MNAFEAVILGIIQGLTEFLPVSSSGHLAVVQQFFGIKEPVLAFDVVLHIGTLVPVFIVFRDEIWAILRHPLQKMTGLLIAATIPAVVAGLLFGDVIEDLFGKIQIIAVCFIITAALLVIADNIKKTKKTDADITYKDAVIVGLFQCVGIPPGISRSGAVITGSLVRGFNRGAATRFTFLLAIPAILGAAVLTGIKVINNNGAASGVSAVCYAAGFVAAMLSGYLAVRFMLALIRSAKLKYFSVYLVIAAAGVIIWTLIK